MSKKRAGLHAGLGVQGSGCRVRDSGVQGHPCILCFGVKGSLVHAMVQGYRVWGSGVPCACCMIRFKPQGYRVQGSGFTSGFRVQGSVVRDKAVGFRGPLCVHDRYCVS